MVEDGAGIVVSSGSSDLENAAGSIPATNFFVIFLRFLHPSVNGLGCCQKYSMEKSSYQGQHAITQYAGPHLVLSLRDQSIHHRENERVLGLLSSLSP